MSYSLSKRIKPKLVDPSIMMSLVKRTQPPSVVVPQQPGVMDIMLKKIHENILLFLIEYFWVIVIIFAITYMLWKRYCWYQKSNLKKKKKQKKYDKNELLINTVVNAQPEQQVVEQQVYMPAYNDNIIYPAQMFEDKNYSIFN